jgi:2-polyprenyl-3-methyl-5-hydroxy-6-metoxy-1,4-benzoquinol methylase
MNICELCSGEVFTRPINPPFSANQCKICGFAKTVLDGPNSITGLYPLTQRLQTYERRQKEFDWRFLQTIEFLKPSSSKASFLEIGGNVGAFSAFLASKGHDVQGVEIQPELANHQRNRGIPCVGSLEELPPGKKYDFVVLMDVLEHIPSCKQFLQDLRCLLLPEGRVFLQFPNHASRDAQRAGERWAWWEAPDHLYHFTPEAVAKIAETAGFMVTEMKTVDLTLDSFLGSFKKPRVTRKILDAVNTRRPINVFKSAKGQNGSLIQTILSVR